MFRVWHGPVRDGESCERACSVGICWCNSPSKTCSSRSSLQTRDLHTGKRTSLVGEFEASEE